MGVYLLTIYIYIYIYYHKSINQIMVSNYVIWELVQQVVYIKMHYETYILLLLLINNTIDEVK